MVNTGTFLEAFAMMPEHRAMLEDERCPVPDETLGQMYRATSHGLSEIIATVSPGARVLLAMYCYRRAHLASIGLAIATTCEKDDLTSLGATSVPTCSNDHAKRRGRRRSLIGARMAGSKLLYRPGHFGSKIRLKTIRIPSPRLYRSL